MGRVRTWLGRNEERLGIWFIVVVLLAVTAGVLYFGTPFHGSDASVQSVIEDDRIDVQRVGGDYVLRPTNGESTTGMVFYPGARVHPDAYLASLSPLVSDANVTVVIVKMPLNLAVLDRDAATEVLDRNHEIQRWYVGGHSLGGAMACRYAGDNPDRVSGVLLLGSYCDQSITDTGLRVLSVTGSEDTVLDQDTYERNKKNVPENATFRELPGVNHTQFGSYTGQPGDKPSGTPYDVAHSQLSNATVPWFRNATAAS
ncbi:MAG: alpha/beta fold hydrolase [Halapricum sp.]